MENNVTKLAKKMRKYENPKKFGCQVGEVLKVEPIKVSILGGAAILDDEIVGICESLIQRTIDISASCPYGSHSTMTINQPLKKGDKVLCLPLEGEQSWIIIDKVV